MLARREFLVLGAGGAIAMAGGAIAIGGTPAGAAQSSPWTAASWRPLARTTMSSTDPLGRRRRLVVGQVTDSGAFLGGAFAVKFTSPDGALQDGIYRVVSRSLGTFKVFLVAGQPGATLVVNRSHR